MIDKLLMIKLNKIILNHRKRTLTDLEIKILERIYNDKTYLQISVELNYTETYLSDQVRGICKILSKEFGTKVTKANLFTVLDLMDKEYRIMLVLPTKTTTLLPSDSNHY
ncbi:MAG TPA: hypothetical protein V6C58_19120 [Allocoleopsis sp.]